MTLSLIPETAPFDAEQRAWLNGFLAGWTGLHGDTQATATLDAPTANGLQIPGPTNGHAAEEEFPWHDSNLPMEERQRLAEGKPLKRRLMAAMAQLDCGACGYLCKTYSEAIADGSEKNLTLCSPGGKETAKKLKQLLKEADSPGTAATNGQFTAEILAAKATIVGYSRANPFTAKLKGCRNLNGPGSSKHTSHVVIDLGGSGLSYRVGDALGVYPTNCPELVEQILERLDFAQGNGAEGSLRTALVNDYDLNDVTDEVAELLLASALNPEEKAALQKLVDADALDGLDLLDVLQLVPSATIDGPQLVAAMSPLNPRLYSIASSLKVHPEEVHLTIAKVNYEQNGRQRKGVASTMFADRLQPGDTVRVFTHATSDFTVPADPNAPMIMVGPGTGVAPFRAFLEERAATGAKGPNWLFFGDQHAAWDFLYEDEFEDLIQRGVLTRLDTAFSRDQAEKIYVQHRMLENGAELFEWLEAGAYFFVCGDAKRMAVDVERALHEIVATHGQRPADAAAGYVDWLKQTHRYVRDVY